MSGITTQREEQSKHGHDEKRTLTAGMQNAGEMSVKNAHLKKFTVAYQ